MKLRIAILSTFVFMTCIGACSSNPKMHYYLLDSDFKVNSQINMKNKIMLEDIVVPMYLKQSKIVLREKKQKIALARFHSWGESLPHQVKRLLLNYLNSENDATGFVKECDKCKKLEIEINHFYPTSEGDVFLNGYFYLRENGKILLVEHFYIKKELEVGGYDEAVKKMSMALVDLANDISNKLKEH